MVGCIINTNVGVIFGVNVFALDDRTTLRLSTSLGVIVRLQLMLDGLSKIGVDACAIGKDPAEVV